MEIPNRPLHLCELRGGQISAREIAGAPVGKAPAGSYTLKSTLELLNFVADSLPVAASLALVAMDSVRSSSIFAFGVVGT